MIERLIKKYIDQGYEPSLLLKIAQEYHRMGQSASAVSFYFKTAEVTDDKDIAYDCLIQIGECFASQGDRQGTVRMMYFHAIDLLPDRHEAYWYLSKNYSFNGDNRSAYYFIKESLKRNKNKESLSELCKLAWELGKVEEVDILNHSI